MSATPCGAAAYVETAAKTDDMARLLPVTNGPGRSGRVQVHHREGERSSPDSGGLEALPVSTDGASGSYIKDDQQGAQSAAAAAPGAHRADQVAGARDRHRPRQVGVPIEISGPRR